jgi:16S rRNA (adenine1518-N6/adenine1519-N6)-dimethyltransferase
MKLSEMRHVLEERGIRLTKSLGQNFLHDQNQLARIVALAELKRTDCILEIGPGLGPLTEQLLQNCREVLAIEKDVRLVTFLKERYDDRPELSLLQADALDYLKLCNHDWTGWKLVSNLPYSVASPILVELAQNPRGPERMVATLQLEVARRLMARSGNEDYGLLTLLVQLDYEPREWFKVPAGCFFPEPDVDSACVCLVRRKSPLLSSVDERETFRKLVKRGFSQRRKMLRKLLKADWPEPLIARAYNQLPQARIEDQARAESLSLEQFVSLARLLTNASLAGGK